jgi:nitroreductase
MEKLRSLTSLPLFLRDLGDPVDREEGVPMDLSAWDVDPKGFQADETCDEQAAFLLRYAVLAPSSHNSQPWRFRVGEGRVEVRLDRTRWLRVADADQRELHISVGCALENLLIAAERFGFRTDVHYFPRAEDPDLAATVDLQRPGSVSAFRPAELFDAIPRRHTNHRRYDGRPLSPEQVQRLEGVAVEPGIAIHLTDDAATRRRVDELVVRADALQFADPAWREELGYWLGQGVFGGGWLLSRVGQLAVTYLNLGKSTAKKDSELLDSASALGVVTAADQEPTRIAQLHVGQAFERMALAATALGIQVQPMNQVLQVPEIEAEFRALLPSDWGIPQLAFRVGFAEAERHTPRRPLREVLTGEG